jgi:hypothetical protein
MQKNAAKRGRERKNMLFRYQISAKYAQEAVQLPRSFVSSRGARDKKESEPLRGSLSIISASVALRRQSTTWVGSGVSSGENNTVDR